MSHIIKGKAAKEFMRRKKEVDDRAERRRKGTSTPEDLKVYKEVQDRLKEALRVFGF